MTRFILSWLHTISKNFPIVWLSLLFELYAGIPYETAHALKKIFNLVFLVIHAVNTGRVNFIKRSMIVETCCFSVVLFGS